MPVARFSVPLPAGQAVTANVVNMIAVSPDGTRIAYVADNRLYMRNLGESEVRPIQGTDAAAGTVGAATPAFSPDGQWLAYLDGSGLRQPA